MPSSTQIKLLLLTIGIAAAAVLVAHGGSLTEAKTLVHEILGTSTVVGLLLLVIDRWAWTWAIFRPWLIKRPTIRGTWRGVLRSQYEVTPGERIPDIPIYLAVKQTLTEIHVTMHSAESSSRTVGGFLETGPDGHRKLGVIYFNQPALHLQNGSRPHHGALTLDLVDDPPCELRGTYWTDRGTSGSLELFERDSHLFDTFEHAKGGKYVAYERNPSRSSWQLWKPRTRRKRKKAA